MNVPSPIIIHDLYSLLSYLSLGLSLLMTRESPALALTPSPFWDGSWQARAGQQKKKIHAL